MSFYLKLASFIPWILYFIEIMFYRISIFDSKGKNKEKYFSYINKNLFSSLNIKELFLFFIFIIFIQYENTTVLEILFATIYIYLLIDFFHGLAYDCKKIKHKMIMVETVILLVLIIGFFLITEHLYTTYLLMFIASILSSFLIYIFGLPIILSNKDKD